METEVTLNHELSVIALRVLRVKTRYNFPRACYLISSQCLGEKKLMYFRDTILFEAQI